MNYGGSSLEPESNPTLSAVGEYGSGVQQVERAWGQTEASQRSAARSFEMSADSHDRAAESSEILARQGVCGAREHAERHREFAQQHRRIAERLRGMADPPVRSNSNPGAQKEGHGFEQQL